MEEELGEERLVEGWSLDPREVRGIARRLGIPDSTSLPLVSVEKDYEDPKLVEYTKDPSGYAILIPRKDVLKFTEKDYTLGPDARDDIRHELAHYIEHLEKGTKPGKSETPELQAKREIDAEFRGKTRLATSKYLYALIVGLVLDYDDLSAEQAVRIVRETALKRGISRSTISRAENLFRDYRETL